ncbi:MAG: two-component regulator propeller domain-containing protein [Balneolaceae bacterium]
MQTIYQDSEGFMWFGTQDGLNRYDGYDVQTYRADPSRPWTLSHNDIRVIYEDSDSTLWVGTQSGGLNRYDRDLDRFFAYERDPDAPEGLRTNAVWDLLEDHRGDFWVATARGLYRMDRETGTFQIPDMLVDGLPSPEVTALFECESNQLWIGTTNGLARMDRDREELEVIPSGPSGVEGLVRVILQDHAGTIWIGTEEEGLYFKEEGATEFERFGMNGNPVSLVDNTVAAMIEDREGKLWLGSGSRGLQILNRDRTRLMHYEQDQTDPWSLNGNGVNALYRGDDGIIWVGAFAGGINFLQESNERFRVYQSNPMNPNSLSNNSVRGFLEAENGDFWVATDGGGLNLFDRESGQFEAIQRNPAQPGGLRSDAILALHENEEGIWIGSYNGGVDRMDPQTHRIRPVLSHDPEDSLSLGSDDVYSVTETSDGKLWFALNRGGISVWDSESGEMMNYRANPDNPEDRSTVNNNDLRMVHEDEEGMIWIGGYGDSGLMRLDRESGQFTFYDLNQGRGYYSSAIHDAYEDREGRFWLATRGGGLVQMDRATESFRYWTTEEGLSGNMVHAIEEDERGRLWLGTNNGITRFNPRTGEMQTYHVEDGLQSNEFNPRSSYKDSDGYLYFGGVNGFNRFHPDSVRVDTWVPTPILTSFQIFNQEVEPGSESPLQRQITQAEQIEIPHTASVISFGFSALDFRPLKGNRFEYRLEGFESDWSTVSGDRQVTYTNIDPGSYDFQVRVSNRDGIRGEPISVRLIVTPPFWQETWFLLMLTVTILGMIWAMIQWRVWQVRKQNRRLAETIQSRTEELQHANDTKDRLFSILAHDLNNVASGILGLTDLLKESVEKEDREETRMYSNYLFNTTGQLVGMLKNLLEWARSQTGALENRPSHLRLDTMVEQVVLQERSRAVQKGIDLSVIIDPDLRIWADPDMLSVVLRNLIHNALKFTESGGSVSVTAEAEEHHVRMSVSDTGLGMSEEVVRDLFENKKQLTTKGTARENGTGLGISLCIDFVERMGGKIHVQSRPGDGTTISFTVPTNPV